LEETVEARVAIAVEAALLRYRNKSTAYAKGPVCKYHNSPQGCAFGHSMKPEEVLASQKAFGKLELARQRVANEEEARKTKEAAQKAREKKKKEEKARIQKAYDEKMRVREDATAATIEYQRQLKNLQRHQSNVRAAKEKERIQHTKVEEQGAFARADQQASTTARASTQTTP
jgi:hypothetical protein